MQCFFLSKKATRYLVNAHAASEHNEMKAFATATNNLNAKKNTPDVGSSSSVTPQTRKNKTHLKSPDRHNHVSNGVKSVIVRIKGTLDELQSKNPIVVLAPETESDVKSLTFSEDAYHPVSDCSATLRGFLSHDSKAPGNMRVNNIHVTRFTNNFPVPIGVFISGVETQPQQEISIGEFDGTISELRTAFNASFSPTTVVKTTIPNNTQKNAKTTLGLKYSKPKSTFLPKSVDDPELVTQIHTDPYAFSSGFSTSSGLSTHNPELRSDSLTSKASNVKRHDGTSVADSCNKKFTQHQINRSTIPVQENGDLSVATPWGSPLHISALNGNIHHTLKKHESTLRQFKIPEEKIKEAIVQAKRISKSNKTIKKTSGWISGSTAPSDRSPAKPESVLSNICDPSYVTFSPDANAPYAEAPFTKESFSTFVSLVHKESGIFREDGGILDPETWATEEKADNWWAAMKSDSVWGESIRGWETASGKVEAARMVLLSHDMVTMYLACLIHERVKSGDSDVRRFTVLFSRLDSPEDWTAKGELSDKQLELCADTSFSAELRMNVYYSIVSSETDTLSKTGSSSFFGNRYSESDDDDDEFQEYSDDDDDYESDEY